MSEHDSDLPSLSLVQAEVDRLIGQQERRSDRHDAMASLLVAFAAALIGLSGNVGIPILAAKVASAVSAAAAISALNVRIIGTARPRFLRDRYLAASVRETAVDLLDSKIWLHERDEKQLDRKRTRVSAALGCLAIGVLFLLLSSFDLATR